MDSALGEDAGPGRNPGAGTSPSETQSRERGLGPGGLFWHQSLGCDLVLGAPPAPTRLLKRHSDDFGDGFPRETTRRTHSIEIQCLFIKRKKKKKRTVEGEALLLLPFLSE